VLLGGATAPGPLLRTCCCSRGWRHTAGAGCCCSSSSACRGGRGGSWRTGLCRCWILHWTGHPWL